MNDYISREALLKCQFEFYSHGTHCYEKAVYADDIKSFPAADVAPVVHGEWVATDMYMVDECSNCGFMICWEDVPRWLLELPRFKCRCPNCWAEMKNGDER